MKTKDQAFVEDFFHDVLRGFSLKYLSAQSMPQARWQDPEVILNAAPLAYDPDNPGKKILVGAFNERLIGIDDNRHILTVAGNRSGKSVTLINNLLFYRGSVLAIDPKAELANCTAERRAALGQKVIVLDPFNIAAERLAAYRKWYNPPAVLKPDSPTIIEDAGLIADGLVIQTAGNKDPHWDESAKNFIEGLMLHVATDDLYEGNRTLVAMNELLIKRALEKIPLSVDEQNVDEQNADDDDESRFAIKEQMLSNARRLQNDEDKLKQDIGSAIEGAALDFYEKSSRERSAVLSTVRRHTKLLSYSAMKRVLSGHDFDLRDLKRDRNGVTVYLCLPASRMGLCNRWLRILINQLLEAMQGEKSTPEAPVLVCLDEFPVLGHMRQLEDAAGQIASFGVKLWVMIQDWGQGKALYKDRWETFVGNAGILQFFGNTDLATTEYLSRLLGKTRVEVSRVSEVAQEQSEQGLTGQTPSIELHSLLTPDEITRQFARSDRLKRQCVIWPGFHPMMLQRVEYFDEMSPHYPVFRGRYATEA
jgi:type IV secretion system protein VirD4